MPIAIATLVLSVVLGLFAPRRIALTVTALAAGLTTLAFVWTVADGKGNDPWWLIPIGLICSGIAVASCLVLLARRDSVTPP